MKVQGKTLQGDYQKSILLPRPDGTVWSFTIRPLRLGFQQWLHERGVVTPAAPLKMVRDSKGRPLRDADGLVLMQRDETEGRYLLEQEKHHQRVAALIVWEGLKADAEIEFETPVPDLEQNWNEFADQLLEELEEAGLTAGDLIWICEQIAAMSNLLGDQLRTQQQHFFPEVTENLS